MKSREKIEEALEKIQKEISESKEVGTPGENLLRIVQEAMAKSLRWVLED